MSQPMSPPAPSPSPSSPPTITLLSLPLEIRLHIYSILFNRRNPHVPRQLYHLPSTCHQLRDEAFPILLKETRHFASIPSLIEWVSRGRWKWLGCVRDMLISTYASRNRDGVRQFPVSLGSVEGVVLEGEGDEEVIDVKWWQRRYARKLAAIKDGGNEMVLSSTLSEKVDYDDVARKVTRYSEQVSEEQRQQQQQQPRRGKRTTVKKFLTVKPGQREEREDNSERPRISNIWNSLIRLRSTIDLRLNLGRYRNVNNYETAMSKPDAEQEIFVQMISLAMPNLRRLTLVTTLLSLPVLQHFQNLTHLEFSGHSLSSPSETLQVLRSLPNLTSLSLGRGPTIYDRDSGLDTDLLHKYQCVTEEVLRGLNPLLALRIVHLTKAHASPFLTKKMLRAALESHNMSLRELRLFSDHPIDREAFQALLDLLPQCLALERINLVLTVAEPKGSQLFDISEYLPPSVYKKDILLR